MRPLHRWRGVGTAARGSCLHLMHLSHPLMHPKESDNAPLTSVEGCGDGCPWQLSPLVEFQKIHRVHRICRHICRRNVQSIPCCRGPIST